MLAEGEDPSDGNGNTRPGPLESAARGGSLAADQLRSRIQAGFVLLTGQS